MSSSGCASAKPPAPQQQPQQQQPQQQQEQREPYSLVGQRPLAGGTLHLVCLDSKRLLRVWLPPGYCRSAAQQQPYPVLLLNDGQNLFEDALSFSGRCWRAAEAAADLIASGRAPPFVVAGVDHAGTQRSFEYLPYPPGSAGGLRPDAANWPGGGVEAYCARLFEEILPWLQREYGVAADPARIALGGSSFGGICTLHACMRWPGRFGAALVESPSLWMADGRFFREDLAAHSGPWPRRLFLGVGTAEYGRPPLDALLLDSCRQLAALLERRGLGPDRLRLQVVEGGVHNEAAWAARLPGALQFLLEPWRQQP